ncbi:CAP domain-containing protein [Teichococcus coralli]|nr:CAP domain-containing protein [Pseudoroseomonas coralli]
MIKQMPGMALVALLLALAASAGAAEGEDLAGLRRHALELVNQARQAQGRAPLETGADLEKAAQSHARDMLKRHYYSHTSPEGDDVRDRYMEAGGSRWDLVEENIARCQNCGPPATAATVGQLQQGWMNSPHHRENILREGLRRFGFGIVVEAGGGLYAVQTFAGPGTSRGGGAEATSDALSGEALSGEALAAGAARMINEARAKEGVGKLQPSVALNTAAQALLPDPGSETISLGSSQQLRDAVPEDQRQRWRSLAVLAGACGGCGTQPTQADLRFFRQQWLNDPQHRQQLLDPVVTDIGFALQANGQGRKVALLVLGTAR